MEKNIKFINYHLCEENIKEKIERIDDIHPDIFIYLHKSIFKRLPLGILYPTIDENVRSRNISLLLDSLSKDYLNMSLSHISPSDIIGKDITALNNLIDIYKGIEEYKLSMGQKKENSNHKTNKKKNKSENYGTKDNRRNDRNHSTDKCSANETQNLEVVQNMCNDKDNKTGDDYQQHNKNNEKEKREKYLKYLIGQVLENRSARSTNRSSEQDKQKYGGRNVNDAALTGFYKAEDEELTLVTLNEPNKKEQNRDGEIVKDFLNRENDVTYTMDEFSSYDSVKSDETYIMKEREYSPATTPSTDVDDDDGSNANKTADLRIWANHAQHDIMRQGYEQQFLDMLLEEEEYLSNQKEKVDEKEKQCQTLSNNNCKNSKSKFEDILIEDNDDDVVKVSSKKCKNNTDQRIRSVGPNCGSFVKPVIKRITHKTKSPKPLSSRLEMDRNDKNNLVGKLLDEFPEIEVSENTLRKMWMANAQHTSMIQKNSCELKGVRNRRRTRKQAEIQERQKMLMQTIQKEAVHEFRARERQDERNAQIAAKRLVARRRQQSAQARRYAKEFADRQKACMVRQKACQEGILWRTFRAALTVQKERIRDIKRLVRDERQQADTEKQREMESLENYYRDRFSMLGDMLKEERKKIALQDKSQSRELSRMKAEMRRKLESEIKQLQDILKNSEHELYFRELDAANTLQRI